MHSNSMLNHRKISSLTFLASHPQQHGSWLHHPQILPVGARSEGSTREIRYYQRQVTAVSVLAPQCSVPASCYTDSQPNFSTGVRANST